MQLTVKDLGSLNRHFNLDPNGLIYISFTENDTEEDVLILHREQFFSDENGNLVILLEDDDE